MIELDNTKVWETGPGAIRQLARLVSAIMARQQLGDELHPTIKVEVGNSVALLVSTVKKETDDGKRKDDPSPGDPADIRAVVVKQGGLGTLQDS